MKLFSILPMAFLSLSALAGSTSLTQAQVLTVRQVLSDCPDTAQAQACTSLADRFVTAREPGPQRDAQIVSLVLAIAEAAQQPGVPMPACLNAADGLRVLADGVQNVGQAQQIRDIADALCEGIQTAAIEAPGAGSGGGGGFTVPQSLVGPGTEGGPGPTGPTGESGPTGPTGESGPTGPTGESGPTGPTGETGVSGGETGPGATGSGSTGHDGTTGPSGPTGNPN
jgi:hypothetical protein